MALLSAANPGHGQKTCLACMSSTQEKSSPTCEGHSTLQDAAKRGESKTMNMLSAKQVTNSQRGEWFCVLNKVR